MYTSNLMEGEDRFSLKKEMNGSLEDCGPPILRGGFMMISKWRRLLININIMPRTPRHPGFSRRLQVTSARCRHLAGQRNTREKRSLSPTQNSTLLSPRPSFLLKLHSQSQRAVEFFRFRSNIMSSVKKKRETTFSDLEI